jgi:hypothetical protein
MGLSGLADASYRMNAVDFAPGDVMTVFGGTGDGVFAYTEVPPVLPTNVVPPSITGTAQEGQTVFCDAGVWDDATAIGRQWFLDGAPAVGTDSHLIEAAEVGKSLTCQVTAISGAGSVSLTTAPVVPVAAPAPPPPPPSGSDGGTADTTGGPSGGAATTSDPGTGSPADPPAVAPAPSPATTPPVAPAMPAPRLLSRPRVSGRPRLGRTLTCTRGRWQGTGLRLTYAWTRNGKAIRRAIAARYRVTKADKRRRLACVVTAANAGGTARVTTPAVGPVR